MSDLFKSIKVLILLLIFTVAAAYVVSSIFASPQGNVALIQIKGEIAPDPELFSAIASSSKIVSRIERAKEDPKIKALLVEINSPGGTVVATREIAKALESVNKTKVCWMRDTAASGAYWIASECDAIVADDFTITGSIGVSGSYLELSGLFEKYGINYVRLVSGENKDAGSMYKEPTEKELRGIQNIIDEMHTAFVKEVAENRNLSLDNVKEIADGSIFTGRKAAELGLIDFLGGEKEAKQVIKQRANISEIKVIRYREEFTITDLFSEFMSKEFSEFLFSKSNPEIKAIR